MADPDTVVQDLAGHFGLDRTSIWSLYRRYEHAELQPHRSRYWKTPTLDEHFRQKAAAVLWC